MAHKRGNGEGSIYRREVDGRWIGSLVVGFTSTGRQRRKTVSAKTRREAVAKLTQLQRDIAGGLQVAEESVTLTQLVTRWYEDVLRHQVQESAASNYFSIARNHLLPTLGKKKLSDLMTVHVDHLLARKIEEGLAPSTVRRVRSVLAQALDQAMRWGYINRNVATLSRSPKVPRVEGRTLTPDQARNFLDVLKGHRNEALYALMLSTGLRRGEALGLKWTDLDESEGVLRVTRQLHRASAGLVLVDTKTALSRRSVNLATPMIDLLKTRRDLQKIEFERLEEQAVSFEFIFTSEVGTPLDPRNLLREFKGLCKKAGLGDWHVHELRHSAASLMLAQGVPLRVVSRVLGHASIRMTADVYGHVLAPDRASAAEAIGAVLWRAE
jgi:integrase